MDMGRSARREQVFRITGARASLTDDVRARQRRYIISMSIRTLCVILAVVLWDVARPVAIVALVGGGILPYIAVVVANAGRENAPGLPSTFVSQQPKPLAGADGGEPPSGPPPGPPSSSPPGAPSGAATGGTGPGTAAYGQASPPAPTAGNGSAGADRPAGARTDGTADGADSREPSTGDGHRERP
jgi:hypothetical protein